MTNKDDLQKELKEKIKPGVKASDIKKLKRSKSESDLPIPPPPPLPPDHLLHDQLKEKQKEIELLRKQKEDSANKVSESKQVEELRAKLTGANNSLSSLDKERQDLRKEKDNQ